METTLITYDSITSSLWTNAGNVIDGDDNTYGSTTTTGNTITVNNSSEIDDTLLEHVGHPQTSIEYFAVRIVAQGILDAFSSIIVRLVGANFTTATQTIAIGISKTTYTIYFVRDTSDERLLGHEIYEDATFGVEVTTSNLTGTLRIYEIDTTLHYLQDTDVHGDLATFPYSNDLIDLVENSPNNSEEDTTYVIKADQMNHLGGAIISIERTLLADSDFLKGLPDGLITIKPPTSSNTILFMSAVVTGSRPNTLLGKYLWTTGVATYMDVSLIDIFSGQSNVAEFPDDLDDFPSDVDRADFNFISGIGWVVDGSDKIPIHISPMRGWLADFDTHVGYGFGFTTTPSPIFDSIQRAMSTTQFANGNTYYDEDHPYFQDLPFEIRLFGIAVIS